MRDILLLYLTLLAGRRELILGLPIVVLAIVGVFVATALLKRDCMRNYYFPTGDADEADELLLAVKVISRRRLRLGDTGKDSAAGTLGVYPFIWPISGYMRLVDGLCL